MIDTPDVPQKNAELAEILGYETVLKTGLTLFL